MTVFAVAFAGGTYLYGFIAGLEPGLESSTEAFVGLMTGQASFYTTSLVAIVGLMTGYSTVVGERESGSLKLLLGLPHSRMDVVVGKTLGRATMLTAGMIVGFAAALAVLLTSYQSFSTTAFLAFAVLTTLLGVAYVGVAVLASASIRSQTRVTAVVVGVFVFLKFVWDSSLLPRLLTYSFTGSFVDTPEWFDYLMNIGPNPAYSTVVSSSLEGFDAVGYYSLVVLLLWMLAPVALAYLKFRNSDV